MVKTRMTTLEIKTFKSLKDTQDLMLKHEIVQKRSGSNTILDQLLAAIKAGGSTRLTVDE